MSWVMKGESVTMARKKKDIVEEMRSWMRRRMTKSFKAPGIVVRVRCLACTEEFSEVGRGLLSMPREWLLCYRQHRGLGRKKKVMQSDLIFRKIIFMTPWNMNRSGVMQKD